MNDLGISRSYCGEAEPYYPVRTEEQVELARKYLAVTKADSKLVAGGRLGTFTYYDMHQAIRAAMSMVKEWGA